MIDILKGTDGTERLTGTESKLGARIAAGVALLCVAGAVAGGAYWFKTHNKPTGIAEPKVSEQAVRDADAKWSQAAKAHDMAALDAFYADDATVLPAHAEMITNKPGALKYWTENLTKNVDVSWTPMYVESAKSGDMVYDLGSYTMTTKPAKGAKGASVVDHGKYLAVWKKQADGSWKAEADTWNSDLPAKKG